MKTILMILLLASVSFAMSWKAFVNLPIDQKMAIQLKNLNRIADGNLSCQYMSREDAAAWLGRKPVEIITPTKFIKVGDHYVSEGVCKTDPSACIEPAKPTVKPAAKPANVRTASQCSAAREKDWQAFVWSNYPNIDPNANGPAKEDLLDRMAEGSRSWQAKCLRGE